MSIAEFVRILGRGPGRSRSLTFEEAHEAMTRVCAGDAAPEALGAMLMLMRMKGETADEIAGFTQALRADCLTVPKPDLDWPSYAAGRTRGLPLFLLSARLVAQAGFTVLLHGWNGLSTSGPRVREGLAGAKIATATTPADIESTLARDGLAYVPLEDLSPVTLSLLKMRTDFGLRSCVNTVARMLNPGSADAALQGVFHPPYLELQMDAASALGQKNLSIVKGGGGEFEVNPSKDIRCFGLRDGAQFNEVIAPVMPAPRKLSDGQSDAGSLAAIWSGETEDAFAVQVVISTAALALKTLGVADPEKRARELWDDRAA